MIIVGLGNPGKEYAQTRHNVGFMFVDRIAEYYNWTFKLEKKFQSFVAGGNLNGEKVILIKPITYMNNSGLAVRSVMDYQKVSVNDILVVYDDMDLPLSTVRIRLSGSSGGHKGMKSVIEHLGTDEIKRLRIGIGHAESDVIDYVLTPFSKTEFQQMKTVLDKAPYIIADYLEKGIDFVMNNYNG